MYTEDEKRDYNRRRAYEIQKSASEDAVYRFRAKPYGGVYRRSDKTLIVPCGFGDAIQVIGEEEFYSVTGFKVTGDATYVIAEDAQGGEHIVHEKRIGRIL